MGISVEAGLLAFVLVGIFYAAQENIGLQLSDEGFLWIGVLRTVDGQIPMRDFKSYDPGRYYWSAAFVPIFGSGILGIRRSIAVLQFLGLWFAIDVLRSQVDNLLILSLIGILLLLWMQPRHKRYDHIISLLAVLFASLLIGSPDTTMFFAAGVFIGIAALFGANHGAYNFCAFSLIILVMLLHLEIESPALKLSIWLTGIAVGYSPMLAMWLFMSGMFQKYWNDRVLRILKESKGNITLPIPWPWRFARRNLPPIYKTANILGGIHFVVLPIFYLLGIIYTSFVVSINIAPMVAASCFVGIFYLHHAFSRADISHLSQSIIPFVTGTISVILWVDSNLFIIITLIFLVISAAATTVYLTPLAQLILSKSKYVRFEIRKDILLLSSGEKYLLENIKCFVNLNLLESDDIFIAPYEPGLYPVLGRKPRLPDDCLLIHENDSNQNLIINGLKEKSVKWVLIKNSALDGREDLRFCNTHRLVWQFVQNAYEAVECPNIGAERQFYRRR